MTLLQMPWIELAILTPMVGAVMLMRLADPDRVWRRSMFVAALTLVAATAAYLDFVAQGAVTARDRLDLMGRVGLEPLVLDELSAPLFPLVALLFALTITATLRAAGRQFSFTSALITEGLVLVTFASTGAAQIVVFLLLGVVPTFFEQRRGRRSARVFVVYMSVFAALLVAGLALTRIGSEGSPLATAGVALTTAALLVRSGVFPFHGWIPDHFERGSFGSAILFTTPMVGIYGMMRLVLPGAPLPLLQVAAGLSLFTALYAASMALVPGTARRFFGFLVVGHSALVLVGLDLATPIALTGALSVWLAVSMALTGLGLTLRCVEARTGRLSLARFHGLYDHVPMLGGLFLVTGLASIGFPGTVGFVGAEMLFEATLDLSFWEGGLLVGAAALNGLAILAAYARVFTGRQHPGTIDLRIRPAERVAVVTLTLLILGGGLYPRLGVASRYRAATRLFEERRASIVERSARSSGAEPRGGTDPAVHVKNESP